MPQHDHEQDEAVRFVRLCDPHDVVPLLNQIPESCRDSEALHRICDVAEALLDPEVPDLLPTSATAAFDRWVGEVMNQRLALALVVVATHAEVIRPQDGDVSVEELRKQLFTAVRGVHSTAAEAAARAIIELSGPIGLDIPFWMQSAVEYEGGYEPCQHILDQVADAVGKVTPGRRWFEGAADLGYVLFQHA